MLIDPARCFQGKLVLVAPHMDDCVLGCGGTLAQLPCGRAVHVIYATDGRASPAPVWPWLDHRVPVPDLAPTRADEARAAMGHLGVPQENINFLGLPDGQLRRHRAALHDALVARLRQIQPDHIWLPFRYDRHADHVALNHAVNAACREAASSAALYEYFVYYRWRLLPEGDVRRYLRPDDVWRVNIAAVAAHKRAALDMFKSQTTRFYPWQNRPNLKPQFLDEVSRTPEFFLRYTASRPGPAVFDRARTWIRVSHWLEPRIKKGKDVAVDLWWSALRGLRE